VAVVVKDRRERMLRCLQALLAQDHPDYEVLVLDNGSSDGTADACRQAAGSASVPVRVEVVEGALGRVRNAAARLSAAEFIAYTDSDCLPSPRWLSAGVAAFADSAVGLVSGMTLPEDSEPEAPWPATVRVTEQSWHFETCNILFRRDALVRAGGFPDDLSWGEDTAAGWAMLRAGWEARFVPEAVVQHDVTYPGRAWHLRRVRRYGGVAAVIREFPEARDKLLWKRYFLRERNARFAAALLGVALTPASRAALLLAVPYLRERGPRGLRFWQLYSSAERIAIDASVFAGMVRGSVRWRALVL